MRLAFVNYNFDIVFVRMCCCIEVILSFSSAVLPPFLLCHVPMFLYFLFFCNRKQNKLNKYIEGQKQKFTQLDLQDVEVREKNKDCKSKGKKLHKQLEKDKEKVCCSFLSPPCYKHASKALVYLGIATCHFVICDCVTVTLIRDAQAHCRHLLGA